MNEKFALITGGAKRIGETTSRYLHEKGFNIILHYNNSEAEAENIGEELNRIRKNSCSTVKANFNSEASINEVVAKLNQITKSLDVLVNNASSFYSTPIDKASLKEWKDLTDTNVTTPLFLTQALAPHLKEAKGCVVNISDTLVKNGIKEYSLYSGAKSALESITKSLAKELAPEVRINGIAPGAILWQDDKDLSDEEKSSVLNKVALGRIGRPEDVASTIFFLTQSKYITGQIINVDGGRFSF
ncbi:MAG TPA: pteridine reductase [SAR86 cluster bacterium]|nr:pteridine reductase [SAR86 cluster bacterium]